MNRCILWKYLDCLGNSATNFRTVNAKGHMVEHVSRCEKNGGRVGDVLESGSPEGVSSSRFEDAVLRRVCLGFETLVRMKRGILSDLEQRQHHRRDQPRGCRWWHRTSSASPSRRTGAGSRRVACRCCRQSYLEIRSSGTASRPLGIVGGRDRRPSSWCSPCGRTWPSFGRFEERSRKRT